MPLRPDRVFRVSPAAGAISRLIVAVSHRADSQPQADADADADRSERDVNRHRAATGQGARPDEGIGLTVNSVTPGYVAVDMLATIPDKVLGRLGKPRLDM